MSPGPEQAIDPAVISIIIAIAMLQDIIMVASLTPSIIREAQKLAEVLGGGWGG